MTQVLTTADIGTLDKISQGAQGIVYRAPSVRTHFAKSMVYKEYKQATSASLNIGALRAMPEFLESLPYRDGSKLISLTAWPCRIVENNGGVTGFVMPIIPDEYFTEFWTNKPSPSRITAEIQHLLNPPQVLAKRFKGGVITERQRYELLRATASALAFLHDHKICVGDFSPKNLLYSLASPVSVYFIDCDAMRVDGVSLATQLETPGWGVPSGEGKATYHSDRYKLGLFALRLLVGDQDVKDPARLPTGVPVEIRRIIVETLSKPPSDRPPLSAWDLALAAAAATAAAQPRPVSANSATATAVNPRPQHSAVLAASRPSGTRPSNVQGGSALPPGSLPAAMSTTGAGYVSSSSPRKWVWLAIPAIAGIFGLLAYIFGGAPDSSQSTSPTMWAPTSPTKWTSPSLAITSSPAASIPSVMPSSVSPMETGEPAAPAYPQQGSPYPPQVPAPAARVASALSFKSKSGNITCTFVNNNGRGIVLCAIKEHSPSDYIGCAQEQQTTMQFVLTEGEMVKANCYSGNDYSPQGATTLEYNRPFANGYIMCQFDRSQGVICRDLQTGHGFQAARESYGVS